LQSANQYTDTSVQAGDAATLKSADAYTDTQTQEALQSAQTYADAGDAQTLVRAEAYTDSKLAAGFVTQDAFNQFQRQVDDRFHQVDVRMARVGAMGQAMGGMAGAIAAGDRTRNRISAAVGSYGGQNAMAVGYSHLLPGHGSVLIGGSIASGGGTGGTVGVSFGW
ncbi:MAG TPA: YadA-like family protein, partial [Rhodanobacteraceae bacterium]|nr:YadA-like family protein [Rhodanobacteraceae bacterium]